MSISVALYKLLSKIRGEKPKKNNPGSKSIEHMINEITKEVEEGGGGSGQQMLDDFIAGNLSKTTYNGELVPHCSFMQYKKKMKEVYLPNATYIGVDAFSSEPDIGSGSEDFINAFNTLNFEKVDMPVVTYIDNSAFKFCTNLKNVNLGNSLIGIGAYAFDECNSLENITFPETLSFIKDHAFKNCSFNTIKLPKSLLYIEDYGFAKTPWLESTRLTVDMTDFDINSEVIKLMDKSVFYDWYQYQEQPPQGLTFIFRDQETINLFINDDNNYWYLLSDRMIVSEE